MQRSHPSKAVANWFIDRFAKDGQQMTQLQVNKLVYIAHGWHLGFSEDADSLIAEPVLAWKYGPVIGTLRDEFKEYGAQGIPRRANESLGSGIGDLDAKLRYEPSLDDTGATDWQKDLLEAVYTSYKYLSGGQLIEITHNPGTPWYITTDGGKNYGVGKVIPTETIANHYKEKVKQLRSTD